MTKKKITFHLLLFFTALFFLLGVFRCGANPFGACLVIAFALGFIFFPGCVFSHLLNVPHAVKIGSSIVLGGAFFAVVTLLASAFHCHWLVAVVPCLVTGTGIFFFFRNHNQYSLSRQNGLCLVLVCFLICIFTLYMPVYAHPSAVESILPSQDFHHNLSIVQAFLQGFPPANLRLAGDTIYYHYLIELLVAGLSMATGQPAYDILAFYSTPLFLCALVFALWECGQVCFSDNVKKTRIFLVGIFFCGGGGLLKVLEYGSPFLNTMPFHVLSNLNSVTSTFLFLSVFVSLFTIFCRDGYSKTIFFTALIAFSCLLLTKGPVAILTGIATGCAIVVLLITTPKQRLQKILFILSIAMLIFMVNTFIFSKLSNDAIVFDISGTLNRGYFQNILAAADIAFPQLYPLVFGGALCAHAILTSPLITTATLCSIPVALKNFKRLSGTQLLAYAGAAGGMAAFFLFEHHAFSQVYFLFSSLFFCTLLAAHFLVDFYRSLKDNATFFKKVLAIVFSLFAFVSCFSGFCHFIVMGQDGIAALTQTQVHNSKTSLTRFDEEAMLWLHDNTTPEDVFATNRIHSGTTLEGYSFVYSALSGRTCYVEAPKPNVTNNSLAQSEVDRRVAVVNNLFGGTDSAAIQSLCQVENITYLVYSNRAAGEWQPPSAFTPVFENQDVMIYKIQ